MFDIDTKVVIDKILIIPVQRNKYKGETGTIKYTQNFQHIGTIYGVKLDRDIEDQDAYVWFDERELKVISEYSEEDVEYEPGVSTAELLKQLFDTEEL